MQCKIVKDSFVHDTFIHAPKSVFKLVSNKSEGTCIKLTSLESGNASYGWMVTSVFPITSTPYIRSAMFNGYFIIEEANNNIPQAVQVLLSVKDIEEYKLIAKYASEIIGNLFLSQVRVIERYKTTFIWLENGTRKVELAVKRLHPDIDCGVVGKDSELVISTPAEGENVITNDDYELFSRVRRYDGPIDGAYAHPSTINKDLPLATHNALQLKLNGESLLVYLNDSLKIGWIYLGRGTMERLELKQHQTIKITDWKFSEDSLTTHLLSNDQRYMYSHSLFTELDVALCSLFAIKPSRGIIIQGESMVGKSRLVLDLVEYGSVPMFYADVFLEAEMNGFVERQRTIENHLREALGMAPCVVIFDHIDRIFKKIKEGVDSESVFLYEQLAFWFMERIRFLGKISCPVVLVVENQDEFEETIARSHFFLKTITVGRPRADLRAKILAESEKVTESAVEKTAGLLPRQIVEFDENYSIRDSSIHLALVSGWKELRGMEYAKIQLEEALFWPIVYADLFSANGFNQPSGVLISGPTGSGKTLLVRLFLNHLPKTVGTFIVSGPSLLGKYVGSSEKAVRDLFSKARSKNPSLVVIEELDSLAPRRGKDNTGTTDRVINQLLTELDGTEDRNGVYLLATTSRADLIDPAILRPGRIETWIELRLPNLNERTSIVQSLIPSALADDKILLEQLSRETDGMTAADIRAIIMDACLGTEINSPCMAEMILESLVQYKASKLGKNSKYDLSTLCQNQRVTFA